MKRFTVFYTFVDVLTQRISAGGCAALGVELVMRRVLAQEGQ